MKNPIETFKQSSASAKSWVEIKELKHQDKKLKSTHSNVDPLLSSISSFSKIFADLPEIDKPLIPFRLINYVFSNYQKKIMTVVFNSIENNKVPEICLETACLITAYALSLIFLGEKTSKKIFKRLITETNVQMIASLPSGKKWTYDIANVFGGDIIRELNNDKTDDEEVTLKREYALPYTNAYIHYFDHQLLNSFKEDAKNDEEKITRIKKLLHNTEYNFNTFTFAALKEEIENNKNRISTDKSYIYFIAITSTASEDLKTSFEHTFIIEQFLLNKSEIRYIIYQSWAMQASLLDEINKRGYGETGENSLTHDDIHNFLINFEGVYSKNRTVTSQQCFGYNSHTKPLTFFNGTQNKLSGLSIRYCSSEVNPQKCPTNLMEFLNSKLELKSAFSEPDGKLEY